MAINIIVPAGAPPATAEAPDRRGGEEHGMMDVLRRAFAPHPAPPGFEQRLAEQLQAIGAALEGSFAALKAYQVTEITVSIAVSAEGDIGIASAGLEGSIELKFERKPSG
jgi:hypothetical protein